MADPIPTILAAKARAMRLLYTGVLTCVFMVNTLKVCGRKNTADQSLVWYGYFMSLHFHPKWYWQTELQERHPINPTAQHQFLVRSHVHRYLGGGWETSVGMCTFWQDPNDPVIKDRLTVLELRPHVEFALKQKLKYLTFDYRYRAEARFFQNTDKDRTKLEDAFGFGNFRFRYRLQASVPIWKIDSERTLKFKVSDEVHVNAGNKIVKNVFEQNRVYAGLAVDVFSNVVFDLGYLNWFQQRPTGEFYNRHILRFTLFYSIHLPAKTLSTKE